MHSELTYTSNIRLEWISRVISAHERDAIFVVRLQNDSEVSKRKTLLCLASIELYDQIIKQFSTSSPNLTALCCTFLRWKEFMRSFALHRNSTGKRVLFCRSHQTAADLCHSVGDFSQANVRNRERKCWRNNMLDKHSNGSCCWKWFGCCYLNLFISQVMERRGFLLRRKLSHRCLLFWLLDIPPNYRPKIPRWLMHSWPNTLHEGKLFIGMNI